MTATSTDSRWTGSIRTAAPRDRAELARLFGPEADTRSLGGEGNHLLVYDIGGELRAAEYVAIGNATGRIEILVIDPRVPHPAARAIEDRMIGVGLALCEAYGCLDVDLGVRRGATSVTWR